MELFLYDLFIWFNFIGFCIAIADKCMAGEITHIMWISIIAFGGCGSAIACFLFRHHTRSGIATVSMIIGVVQVIAVKFHRFPIPVTQAICHAEKRRHAV